MEIAEVRQIGLVFFPVDETVYRENKGTAYHWTVGLEEPLRLGRPWHIEKG